MSGVSVIFSFRYPGKYALTALTGALEGARLSEVTLHHPRELATLRQTVAAELDRGQRVIVAWSFYSPSFPECAEELRALREAEPRPFLAIAGGVHATAEPLQTLRAGFELICIGEGELALVELVRRVRDGEALEGTPGFARLEGVRALHFPKPPRIELDNFPPFAAQAGHFGPIELTRGCVFACRFCQTPFFSKARFRHRSVADVARWAGVMAAREKWDLRFISPTSLSYGSQDEGVNLAAVDELLARVREAMGPRGRVFFGTFPSEVRPEHVTPEALAIIKRWCNNDNLVIGGQSGSERILDSSRRGHDVEAIVRAVRISVDCGLQPNVDFILGLPGETRDDVQQTLALMRRLGGLGARVHGHTFMPLPGTPFRDEPPGFIDDETRAELDRLASQGQLYGHWKQQQQTAQAIAARRDAAKT
ncbi:MAG: TIGR04013 family B12-binding domain/radical SAM domain-containing protein [Myxococcota bacterium]